MFTTEYREYYTARYPLLVLILSASIMKVLYFVCTQYLKAEAS
jgi:hypothetical protein